MVLRASTPDYVYINNHGPYTYEFEITQDSFEVHSLGGPIPDPNWTHIDPNGHFHAFNLSGDGKLLPTLIELEDFIEGGSWERRCILCNELVVPHFLAGGMKHENIPGPKTAMLTIRSYDRDIGHDDRVSFFTRSMFGIARVSGFNFTGAFDGRTVCVKFLCDFVVRRDNDM